jgi:hypothetical protein
VSDAVNARIEANNKKFRLANERIRDTADKVGAEMERLPFLCECPLEECTQILHLTQPEYAAVREHPRRFMTAVGHERAEAPVGRVVSRNDGYVVVEKRGL